MTKMLPYSPEYSTNYYFQVVLQNPDKEAIDKGNLLTQLNMDVINNCDELLAYLVNKEFFYGSHKYSCGGYLEFQGDICEVGGFMPDRWCTLMPSTKFPRTVFAINDDYEEDGQFILHVYYGEYFVLDQTLAIKLPNYVKDELIATIQGHW